MKFFRWLRWKLPHDEQTCRRCYHHSIKRIDFWVPDDVWNTCIPEGGVLCLECFDLTVKERYKAGLIPSDVVWRYVSKLVIYGRALWMLQPWSDAAVQDEREWDTLQVAN